ncbi:unnamed protein product [Acanthoscelides obtectus]|uniref:RRM domain-containing protein n=1 Tax=Acanthoscelides obtectus TaxID=200917 RepID=A0A9P0KJM4_ACAOB|nr:unnamed protein product [Acanthoscelides obtectus]CAK1627856.1 RNA-binding protein 38 [Acanthoscelides obtectus]
MRDRRSTFAKEYINNIVNPLGTRPQRPTTTEAHKQEERAVQATEDHTKAMLMPPTETEPLAGLGGLSVLGATTTLNGPVQSKDTTFTKLFVGGLPYHTSDKSLRDHFAVYGDIEEAVVITDRQTGKSRGYGFDDSKNNANVYRAASTFRKTSYKHGS